MRIVAKLASIIGALLFFTLVVLVGRLNRLIAPENLGDLDV